MVRTTCSARAVNRSWDFWSRAGRSRSRSFARFSRSTRRMKLLVGHGLFDLATPYFGSKVLLDQLPAYAGRTA